MTIHPFKRKEPYRNNARQLGKNPGPEEPVQEWVIVCPSCGADVDGFPDPGEAAYLSGIHNDLHHGHRPEAFVVPLDLASQPVRIAEILDAVLEANSLTYRAHRVGVHQAGAWRAMAAALLYGAFKRRHSGGEQS